MRDVVLFNPAPRSGWQAQRRVELPLSLLCPATPLDRACHPGTATSHPVAGRVRIIDQYANPAWKGELLDALAASPICFGVTCMTGPQILHALAACRLVRQQCPEVPIVWGGIHASLLPQQTLANPYVDIVVVGEGEVTFPQLVETLQTGGPLDGVLGIAYGRDGQYRFTGHRPFVDLDAQPPLSYHLLDMDRYRRRLFGVDHVSFNSSRGCKFRCAYCWDPVMHRRQWRAMRAETIVEHLRRIIRDYGIRGFLFTDDNFFIDMDRARATLEGIVRSGLDISISKLQVRADAVCQMDGEFLDLLVRANVRRIAIGVESGSQRVVELI